MTLSINPSDHSLQLSSRSPGAVPVQPQGAAEKIYVSGIVQGVGLRPVVYRIAAELGLRGSVRHEDRGLLITVRGSRIGLTLLVARLLAECPSLAKIDCIKRQPIRPETVRGTGFCIINRPLAVSGGDGTTPAPIAQRGVCPYCRADIWDCLGADG